MTDPKLREARIAEAKREALQDGWSPFAPGYPDAVLTKFFELTDADWRPEPEVDAVTLAAREWMRVASPSYATAIDNGAWDDGHAANAFRAGHADGQANCADVRRMDWLEGRWVSVEEAPGKYLDHKVPLDVAPDFRTKIDRAMEGGQ